MGGVGLQMTTDGGKTFDTARGVDDPRRHHAIWIDPANSNHIIIGNDGGLAQSLRHGEDVDFMPNLPVGLFYHVAYDMETPYNICGGMQDNYNWCGRARARHGRHRRTTTGPRSRAATASSPCRIRRDSRIIYTESQDGNMIRTNASPARSKSIRPQRRRRASRRYRLHWDTPLDALAARSAVALVAGNRVFASPDRGLNCGRRSARTSRRTRTATTIVTMGLKGSDITHREERRHRQAWPTIVAFAESPKTRRRLLRRHRRRQRAGDARRRQDVDRTSPRSMPALPKGSVRVARSCRRGSTRARSTSRSTTTG